MSGWSEKRSYALAARIMTSSRKTRGEGMDAAGGCENSKPIAYEVCRQRLANP